MLAVVYYSHRQLSPHYASTPTPPTRGEESQAGQVGSWVVVPCYGKKYYIQITTLKGRDIARIPVDDVKVFKSGKCLARWVGEGNQEFGASKECLEQVCGLTFTTNLAEVDDEINRHFALIARMQSLAQRYIQLEFGASSMLKVSGWQQPLFDTVLKLTRMEEEKGFDKSQLPTYISKTCEPDKHSHDELPISLFNVREEGPIHFVLRLSSDPLFKTAKKRFQAALGYPEGEPLLRVSPNDRLSQEWDRELEVYSKIKKVAQSTFVKKITGLMIPIMGKYNHGATCKHYTTNRVHADAIRTDLILPYVKMNLEQVLEQTLTPYQKQRLMLDITEGVYNLHIKIGVAHRDLKPKNVMVKMEEDGNVSAYVIDFEYCKEVESTEEIDIPGSFGWLPPEIIPFLDPSEKGKKHLVNSRKCDAWNLGALLLTIHLNGTPGFVKLQEEKKYAEFLAKVSDLNREPMPTQGTIEWIIRKLLIEKPDQRLSVEQAFTFLQKIPLNGSHINRRSSKDTQGSNDACVVS